ncbi:protein male-specific lethal-3-like [Musca domestica]|uniref:Protein male-specific lethal-3 n=1 Tax=Musca domestica TaxID=7370 RepID=A0A1I8MHH8_MUSDO|nr:protein male-specific lethal-3-like [Musca domestica]
MVSTRGPRSRYFEKGEKVLCYEPDASKAKVLYDSKILGTYETKDKRGRKHIQYKVHFQGWSSSWDRKVSADYVLKDTEENRQLQRDLAEKAQLQLGAYLYRKEHKNKKRSRKTTAINSEDSADASTSPNKLRPRGLSEDNFSSGSTFEKNERYSMKDDETDSCCSSIESFHDEDRVMLRISERLRQYLEYDHDMIVKYGKQHALPSRNPAVSILEKFVKQTALKMVFANNQPEGPPRRRAAQQRTTEKKEKDVEKIISTVALLKEVADGLRIYFDFTIHEYLLYKEEKEYALSYLSEENLNSFTYVPAPAFSLDWFNIKNETYDMTTTAGSISGNVNSSSNSTLENTIEAQQNSANAADAPTNQTPATSQEEQPQRRKLRSHRSDECDFTLENCLASIASTSAGAPTPLNCNIPASGLNHLKSLAPISPQIRDFLQNVLSWRIIPSNAPPGPSMIFGAPHLARLIVKLPEFLNASTMSDEKLKIILQHLDTFVNYLESHKDWFNEENYERKYVNVTQERESEEKSNINVNESSAPANTVAKDQDHVLPPAKSPNVEVMAS